MSDHASDVRAVVHELEQAATVSAARWALPRAPGKWSPAKQRQLLHARHHCAQVTSD